MSRRTKIVATLGPATDTPAALEAVLRAGVDVARVNFSHGAPEEHIGRVANFRAAARRVGKFVAVLADLPGPKLRVKLPALRFLNVGDTIHFSLSSAPIEASDLVITEPEMLADVRPGHRMLLDDGRLQLTAGETSGGRVQARVTVGGPLHPNKGLNLPDTPLTMAALTDRDRAALAVAARAGVDWVAVSFVRGAEAADEVRAACAALGMNVPVLAKIERPEAVRRAGAIIAAFDAIMVARGDLGVELPLEQVPTVQKQLIAEARSAGKPVITATDMLDSMRNNPRPTRAEASDVANAIFDGTDAVMLSGETAVGSYPVEAVSCMDRIAVETESHFALVRGRGPLVTSYTAADEIDESITLAACALADEVGATAIVTPTLSGRTAKLAARHRPRARVVAVAPTDAVLQRLALVWGIAPVRMTPVEPGGDRMTTAVLDAFRAGTIAPGERVVLLAGHPIAGGPRCPTVRVVRIGAGGVPGEP
ncbi:Pyruvate kinase [Gemmata obscuriglobus]|uniref:Pyruvate kinase n=1 Tax=Gemmata obscuriglobus TaxID=114 RepID=A0A2Z3H7E0_9BACT|nr:pyruvate kinase [Gemmata obscuriglobus]AWM39496.1 pyruvate kinase [Gemmata obscuriglobus]QEG27415.1 Pyruvate kinase [Gemmata obscuriglobus]VTS04348.1 pyruvate kinase : Pyruvate kinase OS=Roseiflexus sp. (strain RS-1) GN=RoseRS_1428 PE=3 SV=1: PK: PK_C [Gemmata obscuriglobus UQM 2246]